MNKEEMERIRIESSAIGATAASNAHLLVSLITMEQNVFEKDPARTKDWASVLGIKQPKGKNIVVTVAKLRDIFLTYPFLKREGSGWVEKLAVRGKLICDCCYKVSSKEGKLMASKTAIAEEIVAAAAAKAAKDSSEGSDSGSQDSGREFYDNE